MRPVNVIWICWLLSAKLQAQQQFGFEAYYYTSCNNQRAMPAYKGFYRGNSLLYIEARENYVQRRDFSLTMGKTFIRDGEVSFDITPMAGLSLGKRALGSIELNAN